MFYILYIYIVHSKCSNHFYHFFFHFSHHYDRYFYLETNVL